jgi:adenylate kinase
VTGRERGVWICDNCGGDVVQRDDDRPDAINHRLDLYESQTQPLVEYYATLGILAVVDGVGSPDEVFGRLLVTIETRRRVLPG